MHAHVHSCRFVELTAFISLLLFSFFFAFFCFFFSCSLSLYFGMRVFFTLVKVCSVAVSGCSGQNSLKFSFWIFINDFRFEFSFRIFISRAVKDKDNERRRQEQLARERLEAARLRKKEGRKPQGDDGQLSVIASDLEVEEDVLKLQEMALTSLDLKHQSERELLMTVSLVRVVAISLFLCVSPDSDAGLKIDNLDCV